VEKNLSVYCTILSLFTNTALHGGMNDKLERVGKDFFLVRHPICVLFNRCM